MIDNANFSDIKLIKEKYNDQKNNVHETTEYLELFLRNLLPDEKNELHNREMHISGQFVQSANAINSSAVIAFWKK